ncbi:MAG: histidine kinase [Cyclobacteriaceae bacterium]|nr:histidine kinase [Cyclobacteriaceae bacterium]
MSKKKLYWSLQVGGWTLFAAFQIFFWSFLRPVREMEVLFFIIEATLFLFFTHYFRFLIKRFRWLELSMTLLIPRIFTSALGLSLVLYFFRMGVSLPMGLYDPTTAFNLEYLLGLTFIYFLIFLVWMVLYFAYHFFVQYNNALKHEATIREIELNNLKSQLNPHFIFNALNSIRALVDEDPGKSKRAITQLSGILRNSLVADKKRFTSFAEELSIVKDYLGLERTRYEERLRVKFEIHPASEEFLIPPLMLQTLVENGIKHGIARLKKGGELSLKTYLKDERLYIEIRNAGRYSLTGGEKITGMGLVNTIQRLNLLYGNEAKLNIGNEDQHTVLTQIIIPRTKG